METEHQSGFIFFFIFPCLACICSSISTPLEYETLILRSLPKPQPLSWAIEQDTITHVPPSIESNSVSTAISVDLHHVDNLLPSSLNSTPEALFKLRLQRDSVRVSRLTYMVAGHVRPHKGGDFSSPVTSGLGRGSGEYFTRIGIGTPARYFYSVLDTGSDVSWIQCLPCLKCYYPQTDPIFNPARSKSYAPLACNSTLCRRLDPPGCSKRRKKCQYQVLYGDGSFTKGDFATETLTFRGTRVNHVAIGCGHDNEGLFVAAAGLLGLGRGKLSFPTQTGRRFGRKFSYCLVDRSATSKPSSILFGQKSVSRKAVFTPLITNPKIDTFYYVGLNGISVGGVRVPGITASNFRIDRNGDGGVIIDSGTSVTRLIRPAYIALRDAFRAKASNLKLTKGYTLFDTCFDFAGVSEVKVPTLVLHFTNADVILPASNYLIPVDGKGNYCFAFAGTVGGLSIIGNVQQQGIRIVFDLEKSRVGFAANGC